MKQSFVVNAETRTLLGKGASRRLRRLGQVPAVVYGGKDAAQSITLNHNEMWKHQKIESFYSKILTLKVDGKEQQVVLKDMQRNPVNEFLRHVDFLRIQADVAIRMQVPLHFKGADVAPGVKVGGGIIEHLLNQVTVECLPKYLPEYIEIDLSAMEVNQSIHLSQITLADGVEFVELKQGNDPAAVACHLPRVVTEEEAAAPVAAEVPAANQKAPAAAAAAPAGKGGKAAPAAAPAAKAAPAKKK